MYLRAKNEDQWARERDARVQERIKVLEGSIGEQPNPANAPYRVELASLLGWRGRYRSVLALAEPLTGDDFASEIAMEARQIIADVYFRHDQFDLADRQYQDNLRFAAKCGNEYWIARAKDGLAWVLVEVGHYASGEFKEAARIFEENLPIYRRLGRPIAEAMGLQGMSRAVAGAGDYDGAIAYADRTIESLRANGGEDFLQLPILQIACVYRDYGAFERSRPYFDAAIDAADRSQEPSGQAQAAFGYGCLLQFLGEVDEARALWRQILPMVEEMGFPKIGHEACAKLAQLAVEDGDFEEAYRRQIASHEHGNRIGVISSHLQNQQSLLRAQIQKASQLEDTLVHLTAGIEASPDGIFVLGAAESTIDKNSFVIRYANAAAAALLARKPSELMFTLLREVWRSPSAQLLLDASSIVYRGGAPRTIDPIQLQFPGVEANWFSVKIVPTPDGVAWTVSDVTEREALQQEITRQHDRLEQANERLTALDREKTEMLGMAAHDLRSPIANIHAICDFIPRRDEEVAHWVDLIESVSASMLELIGNLLDVNRIERGEHNVRIEPVDVSRVLCRVEQEFSARACQKRITLVNEASQSSLTALADQESLVKAVENLASNALKFSPAGSSVKLKAFGSGACVRVEVRDQGPGISEQDQKKLFGKFVRLSARPTAGESSTGLGLSIVKRLVEAMGGAIGCESELGRGALFWIQLPSTADTAGIETGP